MWDGDTGDGDQVKSTAASELGFLNERWTSGDCLRLNQEHWVLVDLESLAFSPGQRWKDTDR
jgi:hypothetical protein